MEKLKVKFSEVPVPNLLICGVFSWVYFVLVRTISVASNAD